MYLPEKSKYVPIGLQVHTHRQTHMMPMLESLVELKAYGRQKKGGWEYGTDIFKHLKKPISAEILDLLLDNPGFIPSSWKGKLIFFWGTIYKAKASDHVIVAAANNGEITSEKKTIERDILYVRFLYNAGGVWKSDYLDIDDQFGPTRLSAEVAEEKTWWQRLISIFK